MAHAHMASEVKLYPTKPAAIVRMASSSVKTQELKTRAEESEESDLGGRQLG